MEKESVKMFGYIVTELKMDILITLTMKELDRYKIAQKLIEKELSAEEA